MSDDLVVGITCAGILLFFSFLTGFLARRLILRGKIILFLLISLIIGINFFVIYGLEAEEPSKAMYTTMISFLIGLGFSYLKKIT